jgi:hypothetical protein
MATVCAVVGNKKKLWGLDTGLFHTVAPLDQLEADLNLLSGPDTTVEYLEALPVGTSAEGATIQAEMVVRNAHVGIGGAYYPIDIFGVTGAGKVGYTIGLNDMIKLHMELSPARNTMRMRLPSDRRRLMPGFVPPTRPPWWRGDWVPTQWVDIYWKSFWVHLKASK